MHLAERGAVTLDSVVPPTTGRSRRSPAHPSRASIRSAARWPPRSISTSPAESSAPTAPRRPGRNWCAAGSTLDSAVRKWALDSGLLVRRRSEWLVRVANVVALVLLVLASIRLLGAPTMWVLPFGAFFYASAPGWLPGVGTRRTAEGRRLWSAAEGFHRIGHRLGAGPLRLQCPQRPLYRLPAVRRGRRVSRRPGPPSTGRRPVKRLPRRAGCTAAAEMPRPSLRGSPTASPRPCPRRSAPTPPPSRRRAAGALPAAVAVGEEAVAAGVAPGDDPLTAAHKLIGVRLVFAGTPAPALPALRRLIASPRHEVIAVLTRPDAAAGRRGKPAPSPVAALAEDAGIPVLKPARPNTGEFVAELAALEPDCCPVVAYGALLGPELLAVPPRGWVNLHFSLLPAWRGAAPVQAAIAAGDTVTGATTFAIEPDLDSGPIYGVVTETIRNTDTAGGPAGPARRIRRRPAGGHPGRHRLSCPDRRAATHRRDQPGPEDHRRGRPGALERARPGRRPAHPRRHPQPGSLDHDRRPASQGRPGVPGRRGGVGARRDSRRTQPGTGRNRFSAGAIGCSRRAKSRWPRPTGLAVPASTRRWPDEPRDNMNQQGNGPRRPRTDRDRDRARGDRARGDRPRTDRPRQDPRRQPSRPRPAGRVRHAAGRHRARLLRQPRAAGAAGRTRNHRPRRRIRHRTDLRHLPHPRSARRHHRRRRQPPSRRYRPDPAGPAAPRRLPAAAHRVEPHAALDTTVSAAKNEFDSVRGGFVNAVLRNISTRDLDGWIAELAPDRATDPIGNLAFAHAHPRWIARAFADTLGRRRPSCPRCWPPTTPAPRFIWPPGPGCDRRRAGRTDRRHPRPLLAVRGVPARR